MADSILTPVAKKIVDELGSAAVKEIGLLWGVKNELQKLESTVSLIKEVLLDAEEQQVQSPPVKNWLLRLEDSVYEDDDLLDEFNTEAVIREALLGIKLATQVRALFSSSNQLVFQCKIGHRLRAIRKKLDGIAKDRRNFQLEVGREERQAREQTHSFVREEEVIGREKDKMRLLDLLLEAKSGERVSFIPIVGMGGLGKTALSQLLFNDENVQNHFEPKLWVCVSEVFELKQIVRKIIKSATNSSPDDLDMDQLQAELRRHINGKRYLLVLDDVWNDDREKWLRLRKLLTSGGEWSRVVITTRSKVVADISGTVRPYQLGILDEEQSWSLFRKLAFKPGKEPENSNIVRIGKEIVKKCGGIPLAIRSIGSALYCKSSETEWSSFNRKISLMKSHDILSILKVSYDNLSLPLKHCFAYCSLFPRDHEFEIQELIAFLMAQGFLRSSNPYQCLDDLGHEYFMELLSRSFFQEIMLPEDEIPTYKMHDLMHDLATLVAGTKCATISSNEGSINERTHHVAFDFHLWSQNQIPNSCSTERRIKTILFPRVDYPQENKASSSSKSIWNIIIFNFKFLCTLNLGNLGIQMVPDSIHKLKHLRYLDVSNNDIKVLPNSIVKLQNLQTLILHHSRIESIPNGIGKLKRLEYIDLSFSCVKTLPDSLIMLENLVSLDLCSCEKLKALPGGIGKLDKLKYLSIDDCVTHMPRGMSQLRNLQMLSHFPLCRGTDSVSEGSAELDELMGLNNLKGNLTFSNLRHGKEAFMESQAANPKDKKNLNFLSFIWDCSNVVDLDETRVIGYELSLDGLEPHINLKGLSLEHYGGTRFSSWLLSMTNLETIMLTECKKCQYLPLLIQFHSLKYLILKELTCPEYISNSGGNDYSHSMPWPSPSTLLPS